MKLRKDVIIIFLIGFGLYANTLTHQYALDDKIVITENEFTKEGFSGIGDIMTTDVFVGFYGTDKNLVAGKRYRPLSLVTFAIEYQLFGSYPTFLVFFSHLINVLLYAFTGVLIYILLLKILPDRNGNSVFWATAFVATCIYITHPIHVEVVANIKGRDEILTLLGGLGALYFSLKYLEDTKKKTLLFACLCLFLGLFAKENAITFLAVIPATIHFLSPDKWAENKRIILSLVATAALYLGIRFQLLGIPDMKEATELMNNPFLGASLADKYATISYTFGKYMYLLVFPHPLTHDYYPFQIPIISWTDYRAIVPFILISFITYWSLKSFKNRKPTFYAFFFTLATFSIVSNVVVAVGSFMNDRFMYIPSMGFAMAVGIGLTHGIFKHLKSEPKWRPLVRGFTVLVLLGYSYQTISRNTAWENDLVLSTTDVEISTNSAKANMSAGLSLITKAQAEKDDAVRRPDLVQAITYLNKSLSLYPGYIQPMLLSGNAYYELGDYANALVYFEACLQITPGYSYAVNNIEHVGDISSKNGNVEMALKSYILLSRYTPNNYRIYLKLGQIYGRDLNDNESALSNFLIADRLKPNDLEVLNKLGIVYSMLGRGAEALDVFQRVIKQDPENANTLLNIGITYNQMGQPELGKPYIDKAISIDPNLGRQ